jgi:hypothetical protein
MKETKLTKSEQRRAIKKYGSKTVLREQEIMKIVLEYFLESGIAPDEIHIETSGMADATVAVWCLKKKRLKREKKKDSWELED